MADKLANNAIPLLDASPKCHESILINTPIPRHDDNQSDDRQTFSFLLFDFPDRQYKKVRQKQEN
ncbi:hypothetical protein [Methylomonas sp. ZR1]|uniref:hypothetical protein n=1 Tax=Methylomonas sp. ZR1 TaxID=1797072 RepID=UPI0014931488|nr:hypothetical protein [Methylomonas sp. ZR1]NOV31282.1 hypothetical protein [Methylomonas sp. ZR1]